MESTNFPERANAIAKEIEKTRPHVVGLQEMSNTYQQDGSDFIIGNIIIASDPLYNFQEILMDAIEAQGLNYTVAAVVENADVELPMLIGFSGTTPLLRDVRLVDHDIILVRNDVTFSEPEAVTYDSMLVVPDGPIYIPRGYVKIKAKVGETEFVYANTHLESADIISIRKGQAEQLLADLADETLPVIISGDFNSVAPSGQTYQYVLAQGYTDTWLDNPLTYNENGYTFGHASNLQNETPSFRIRIDFNFINADNNPTIGEGFVLGDETRDKTSSGLWASDHGGVVTKITFPVPSKLAVK
jgi:endonuclease/exonuclease/phosphatase family metal-dependent hydrolase